MSRFLIKWWWLVLLLIVTVSFGQSINFDLWQDDNALIFKLQHLKEQVGVFGSGSLGLGAYRYIAVPYIPIYQLFGLNIPIFYVWAIFFYFLATISIYFLAKKVTGNNFLSFFSGAIFAAGFIGSDGILRLFNSIQTSLSVVFVCLFFATLYHFTKSRKFVYYFLALLIFTLTLETAFLRTQYLIFPVIVFFLTFLIRWSDFKRRGGDIFLLIPFILIYKIIFERSADSRANLIGDFILNILSGKLQALHGFFGTLGNIVIVSPVNDFLFFLASNFSLDYSNRLLILELLFLITNLIGINFILRKKHVAARLFFSTFLFFWYGFILIFFHDSELIFRHSLGIDTKSILSSFIGGLSLIFVSSVFFVLKDKNILKLALFLLSVLLFNILVYSIYLPFSPLESINRYLVHSLAAYSIFVPLIIYHFKKRLAYVIVFFIVILNISFSIIYQNKFITEKSIPTSKFYRSLGQYVPEIKKGSIFYFDIADNEKSQQEFRDFFSVGSMPDSTAIAVRYGIDRYDFKITQDFNEFIYLLSEQPLNSGFSFFYGTDGLIDTTKIMRSNLDYENVVFINQKDLGNLSLVSPAILEFRAKVTPKISVKQNCSNFPGDRTIFFDYLLSREIFYRETLVKTSSQEKYQEDKYLTDRRYETLWRGSRGWWHVNKNEEIILDLGKNKKISQIIWVNGYANSTPTKYSIEISLDGQIWEEVKKVNSPARKENLDLVVDNFKLSYARYVKFFIKETFDNDSPAIGEIEVVDEKFSGIDKGKIDLLEALAFCASDQDALSSITEFISKGGVEGIVSWKTDKKLDNVVKFRLKADGASHIYQVFLPPGGTKMYDLKIESGLIPAELSLANMRVVYPKKEELEK